MPTNTQYSPHNLTQLDNQKVVKDAKSVSANCAAGTTTNIDLTLTDDELLMGAVLLVTGANQGDSITFQVLTPLGSIFAQFITGWFVSPNDTIQVLPTAQFINKVPAGFTLRVIYNSVGLLVQPWAAINYDFQKVLV